MSELKGYKGKIRDFLIQNKVDVGDLIKITAELTYSGILYTFSLDPASSGDFRKFRNKIYRPYRFLSKLIFTTNFNR